MTKTLILGLAASILAANAFAQNPPSKQEITKQIIRSVTGYANAISCQGVAIESTKIATLVPYKSIEDRLDARYAVLWVGDIGCAGGSGTEMTNIAMVTVGAGDSFVVDPLISSPVAKFLSPVRYIEKIIGNTHDSLIVEGYEYGEEDPNCCPSIRVRLTLRVDQNGNWKATEKKVMPTRKQ